MVYDELTSENFLLFAAKHYYSLHYSTVEFNADLKRISYVKRLIKKYIKSGELADRLILNHLILLFNVFEPISAVNSMLFFKLEKENYSVLKTFLVYLNRMQDTVRVNNTVIVSSDILLDMNVANILRKL